MPEEKKTDDQTPPTVQEIEQLRQAKTELDALKPGLILDFKDGDKSEKVDMSTPEGRKRAAELGSAGYHLSQKAAKLNQAQAALDAEVQKRVEAELVARGQSTDASGQEVDVEKLVADNPELAQAVEDGNPEAFKKGLTKVLKEALKAMPKPEPPKDKGGVTNDYVRRTIAYETRILPDSKFQLLATKLGRGDPVAGAKMIAADYKEKVDSGTIPADADYAATFLSNAHAWADDLGLKVEPSKPEEEEVTEEADGGKTTPPQGGGAGAGAGAGVQAPTFKTKADAIKWRKERDAKERKGGRLHSSYDV